MAMESSIIPVPSEVVMAPAAFWAAQGQMSLWGVILAGTLGSYFGSATNYGVARAFGLPIILRYGKYFLLPQKKIAIAQDWVRHHGVIGVFVARFLPVIRHLVSIPAGVCRMDFMRFSIATMLGAGLWCMILSLFGRKVLGEHPELLNSPEDMVHVLKSQMIWIVGAVVVLLGLYAIAVRRRDTA